MSTVEEITAAITRLPGDEAGRLQTWLEKYAEWQWVQQIERDVRDGKLCTLINRALEEHNAGRDSTRRTEMIRPM